VLAKVVFRNSKKEYVIMCYLAGAIAQLRGESQMRIRSNGGITISRGNQDENSDENLLQCHFVHQESHIKSPETVTEALR
jgi:hypothetical protein